MNTSVDISMTENVSSVASRGAEGLEKFVASADKINSSFDPKILNDYTKELTKLTDQFSKLYQSQGSTQAQSVGNRAGGIQSFASGAGSALTSVSSGRVAEGGATGLASLLKLGGGVGALVAGLGLVGAGVTNKLADQYGQRATPAGRLASLQGSFSSNMESNDQALALAMQETVDSVSKYGKTFQEGTQAREAYLKAGGQRLGASQAGAFSMLYKGEDYAGMASYEGLLSRYGQYGGLNEARGSQRAQGLGNAQFGEVMGGIQDIFSAYLGQGIIKDTGDIARNQEFIGRAGKTFQGALGSQRLQGLNQAVTGAGNLQSQEDMIWFQAGKALTENGAGGLWETKKKLSTEGFSPEFFNSLMGQYEKLGYNTEQSKLSFQRTTGLSETAIDEIWGLKGQGGLTKEKLAQLGAVIPGSGETTQDEYTGNVENLVQKVMSTLGETAYQTRAGIFDIGNSEKAKEISTNTIRTAKIVVDENFSTDAFGSEVYNPAKSMSGVKQGYGDLIRMFDTARSAGVSETDLYGSVRAKYKDITSRKGEGGTAITEGELAEVAKLLSVLIEATNKTTEAVLTPVEIENYAHGAME